MSTFLEPSIEYCGTLEKLLSSSEGAGYFSYGIGGSLDDMLGKRKVLLAGDPGYGKSRILREIVVKLNQREKSGIYIDLKALGKRTVEDALSSNEVILGAAGATVNASRERIFQNENFSLKNSADVVVCLDALDEVKQDEFSDVVERIKVFAKKYNEVQIVLSCRRNYIAKWQHLFADQSFSYFHLLCLGHDQIRSFLTDSGLSEIDANTILDKVRFGERLPLIRVPRYLEMMPGFIRSQGISALSTITKSSLFEFFVDAELTSEEKKVGAPNYKPMVRKVLEKLALIMEIYQANEIQKSELMNFFDDTKSNLNISFLGQVPIEFFYGRSLIKENPDTIEFVNTEFQEYLASCEVLSLGRIDQVIYDLMIVKELREIHPSWLSVLAFLLERNSSVLVGIIENTVLQWGLEDHLKLLPTTGVDSLSSKDRQMIFTKVLDGFKQNGHWIGYDVAERLVEYYQKSFHKHVDAYFKTTHQNQDIVEVCKANALLLSGYIAEKDLLTQSQRKLWKQRLVKAINSPYINEVLPRFSLLALASFKDETVFTKALVDKVYESDEDTIISNLVYAFEKVGIETEAAVYCILRGIKKNVISARHAVTNITSPLAINLLIDGMISDKDVLNEFLDHETVYKNDAEKILLNFESVIDKALIIKLKALFSSCFVVESWYDAEHSAFVKGLAMLINKHSPGYLFELIEGNKKTDYLHAHSNVFIALLEKEDVPKFVSELSEFEWIMFPIIRAASTGESERAKEISQVARKLLAKQFAQLDKAIKNDALRGEMERAKIYKEFQFKLQPAEKKWMLELFTYYLQHQKALDEMITTAERDRMKYLACDDILARFDPGTQELRYTQKSENTSTYTTHQYIHVFGDALKLASTLRLDVSKARQHIINYIPFAYSEHLEPILELVENPTKAEIENLLKVYESRTDDLPKFMPMSFIQFAQRHKSIEVLPILKMFVESADLSDYDRKEAFNVAIDLVEDPKKYAQITFKNAKDDASGKSNLLRNAANAFLITSYSDTKAIAWRVGKILEKAAPFKRAKGVHFMGDLENELDDKEFAKPLFTLKSREHKDLFLEILERALDLLENGEEFQSYASYLWTISVNYYKNLKQDRSYAPLHDLEAFIRKNRNRRGINWFVYNYQSLKKEYILFVAKHQNIADCIKQYNHFKEIVYLDVATERDLYEQVKKILDRDIRNWVEGGAYQMLISDRRKAEDFIQKTIVPKIENCFMSAGLRKPEIPREVQIPDDKRADLLIYYGFIGPVLIEIKLSDNDEITNPAKRRLYKSKFLQYLQGTGAIRGIYLVFKVNKIHDKHIHSLRGQYAGEGSIEVVELSCLKKQIKEKESSNAKGKGKAKTSSVSRKKVVVKTKKIEK
jgi:hypothetical protein